jgi:hypothetical protein
MHDVVIVGVPLAGILAGIVIRRSDIKDLRSDMNSFFTDMNGFGGDMNARFNKVDDRLVRISADLRQLYRRTCKLEARMDGLEKCG